MTKLQYILKLLVCVSVTFAAAACGTVFDAEQDCSTKVKFEFRKHRQALQAVNSNPADVFASTVASVHLFVYNADNGQLVFEQFANTESLKTETELKTGTGNDRCLLPVDLEAGNYTFVAWCGLDQTDQNNAFDLVGGNGSGYDECRVKLAAQGYPVSTAKYDALYHGTAVDVAVSGAGDVVTVELTKNTNDIAVWVQHTTAAFDKGDYEVVYTDANGSMKFEDNSLTDNSQLEYRAHTTSLLTAETEYNGQLVEAGALVAHLSTARLMDAHKNDARLEVRNKDGVTVFSIPFIKYVLEMQTFTANGQYYLDCEDTYNCSFYLSGSGELWAPALIIINNWVKVPDQTDVLGR